MTTYCDHLTRVSADSLFIIPDEYSTHYRSKYPKKDMTSHQLKLADHVNSKWHRLERVLESFGSYIENGVTLPYHIADDIAERFHHFSWISADGSTYREMIQESYDELSFEDGGENGDIGDFRAASLLEVIAPRKVREFETEIASHIAHSGGWDSTYEDRDLLFKQRYGAESFQSSEPYSLAEFLNSLVPTPEEYEAMGYAKLSSLQRKLLTAVNEEDDSNALEHLKDVSNVLDKMTKENTEHVRSA